MPEEKKGRMARVYQKPKEKASLPERGQRTSTNKERTKAQPKTAPKKRMGY